MATASINHKVCTLCKIAKPLTEFYKNASTRDGLHGRCKPCFKQDVKATYEKHKHHRKKASPEQQQKNRQRYVEKYKYTRNYYAWRLQYFYGLSVDDYARMLADQNGGCAICGRPPQKGKRLHVDHCHETGRIRGLLCSGCNQGLGRFGDNIEGLMKAVQYLQQAAN